MKDKLRELAERWSDARNFGTSDYAPVQSEELLAILDAEGDGGAVHYTSANGDKCYTHSARSGVVSDEDVEAACEMIYGWWWQSACKGARPGARKEMRAALEHFAKGERHER